MTLLDLQVNLCSQRDHLVGFLSINLKIINIYIFERSSSANLIEICSVGADYRKNCVERKGYFRFCKITKKFDTASHNCIHFHKNYKVDQ